MNHLEKCVLYSSRRSSRLDYVIELMRLCWPKVNVGWSSERLPSESGLLQIAYGVAESDGIHIPDEGLLWKHGYDIAKSPLKRWNDDTREVTQDILSSIFYVATRYEEYSSANLDAHERWVGEHSDLAQIDLLDSPAIPFWLGKLCELGGFKIPKRPVKKILSCDIDQAYKFKNRGGIRNLIGKLIGDPYDTYSTFSRLSERYNTELIYFIPASEKNTDYDKAAHPSLGYMKTLGVRLQEIAKIGLHPGYYTMDDQDKLTAEKISLEKNWSIKVTKARMHYLRLQFPHTYKNLIVSGITDDYTMGYADRIGWRSGMHTAYPWYDLDHEVITSLTIHPLNLMDVTVKNYLGLSGSGMDEKADHLSSVLSKYGGEWCVLWHNSSFDPKEGWSVDSQVLEKFLAI